ncbi:MAG: hypothetical protein HY696_04300 [Deltaproteobacteria bacterium]|nr:hypothetical protein [Deltaproteobacteria bacterium]
MGRTSAVSVTTVAATVTKPRPEVPDTAAWIEWVEQTPLVPRWRWNDKSRQRWESTLEQHTIRRCLDANGNMLLGATSPEQWYRKIQNGQIRCIVQAHLDHPGGIVTRVMPMQQGPYRYVARVEGGGRERWNGTAWRLVDADGNALEEVVIDHAVRGFHERWISFRSPTQYPLPLYLLPPDRNGPDADPAWVEGWGLDDHLGCALLLQCFAEQVPEDVLGVLTLDEEIGGGGLFTLRRAGDKLGFTAGQWPLLLSLEAAGENPQYEVACGGGCYVRSQDRIATLDTAFVHWAEAAKIGATKSLPTGACEAGLWTRAGGRAACLVVPLQFYHNGVREGEWRAERAQYRDVRSLAIALRTCIAQWEDIASSPPTACDGSSTAAAAVRPHFVIHDDVTPLRIAATTVTEYVDCLQSVLPCWNTALHGLGQAPMKFSADQWPAWREQLLTPRPWMESLAARTEQWSQTVRDWLGITQLPRASLPIHLCLGASFNASQIDSGIALSVEKIAAHDLDRILIHELTHWWIGTLIQTRAFRPLFATLLHEGLACLATMQLLALPEARAVAMPDAHLAHLEAEWAQIIGHLAHWWNGTLLTSTQRRHEHVSPLVPPHPFAINRGETWVKYGYFIAVRLLAAQRVAAGQWQPWIEQTSETLLDQFFVRVT